MKALAAMSEPVANGEAYEEEHVHEVYEQIASHFSSTRYKVRLDALGAFDDVPMIKKKTLCADSFYESLGLSLNVFCKDWHPARSVSTSAVAMANTWP